MMYKMTYANKTVIFTGDCIFLGGVGKFFEGTAEQMTYILRKCVKEIAPDA